MKVVKKETDCEVCGKLFMGEFIQHDTPDDDWEWERDPRSLEIIGETEDDIAYPHIHEQPTVECHICPDCRQKKNEVEKCK